MITGFGKFCATVVLRKMNILGIRLSRFVSHDVGYRRISSFIDVSSEVRNALNNNKPIVALETALVTHGMPYPDNLDTIKASKNAILSQGAVPATVGVVKGRIKVGVDVDSLRRLAEGNEPAIKVSRRDLPYVVSKGLNGGTTVSGTMVVAHLVGIDVFATGGIGGVHRGGENSLDISADLIELGRTPVAVVASGAKSILDIGRTLEVLETQGVCVAVLGSPGSSFPAFYSKESAHRAPHSVRSPGEAAELVYALQDLGLSSGLLLAVPPPSNSALPDQEAEAVVKQALKEIETEGVTGAEVTPAVLERVAELTLGRSRAANRDLVANNALVAAELAVALRRQRPAPGAGRYP